MSFRRRRSALAIAFAVLAVSIVSSRPLVNFVRFPAQVKMGEYQIRSLDPGLPFLRAEVGQKDIVHVEHASPGGKSLRVPLNFKALGPGTTTLELKLFGLIPVRKLTVEVVPRIWFHPGGHSIGILLHADGVIITRVLAVRDESGKNVYPARDAGVQAGDVILKVNGEEVRTEESLSKALDAAGQAGTAAVLEIRRGQALLSRTARPVLCRETRRYRLGVMVRDGAAGVGTLSFYDKLTKRYAALGHIITDGETGTPVSIYDGKVVKAQVTGIEEGRKGRPGEKLGVFLEEKDVLGTIDTNGEFGISGTLMGDLENPFFDQPIAMGLMSEVEEGPAYILTVVDGHRLEKFEVLILRVNRQQKPEGKGMVVKIIDPGLLKKTGGIVQGMSGSPIIQNGKLIGAITHVLVNDPTRGFGVFAEWMAERAGMLRRTSDGAGSNRLSSVSSFLTRNLGISSAG